jgi:probable HAF family extracellular repeat protein
MNKCRFNPATPKPGLPPSTARRKALFRGSAIRIGRASQALAAIVIGLAGISAASAQPLYSVTDLGVLPGSASCVPYRMNDRGDVVGYCAPAGANYNNLTAFVWRNGAMSDVGKLTGGHYSLGMAINSLGVITGDGDTGNLRPQSWVTTTTPGVLLNIFPNNGGNTHTLFIADNGMIGGYYTKSLSGNTGSWKGAIWTPDPKDPRKYRTTDLPVLPGAINPKSSSSIPAVFNQSGQAAGYASNDQIIGPHAAFWNNDATHSIVDLGVFPGDQGSYAHGMNDFGQVVGESHTPVGLPRAVVWNNDAAHTLSELPPLAGDNYAIAGSINNSGQVLGVSFYEPPGVTAFNEGVPAYRVVLWRDGGVFELQTLVDPATGAGWTNIMPNAINSLGQMAGSGVFNGQTRAILLTPLP